MACLHVMTVVSIAKFTSCSKMQAPSGATEPESGMPSFRALTTRRKALVRRQNGNVKEKCGKVEFAWHNRVCFGAS